jgi:cytochrome c553
MKRALALLSLGICAGSIQLAAAAEPARGDSAKGQSIANKICASCHGADGNSPTPANPNLAGQIPEYIYKQLVNFRASPGKKAERENPVMAGMTATLSAEDMRNVAAYYAAQPAKPGTARNKETLALGRRIWRGGDLAKGLPACAGCHGAAGVGIRRSIPVLPANTPDIPRRN